MAKKFAGFKPETMKNKILPALGYNGPTDQKSVNEFLAANPAAAAKMGKFTLAARRAVEGKPVKMNEGGTTEKKDSSANIMTKAITADPTKLAITPDVVANDGGEATKILEGTGQVGPAATAGQTTAEQGPLAEAAPTTPAATVEAEAAADKVADATSGVTGATGEVSDESQVTAETVDPTASESAKLEAAQGESVDVTGAPTRVLEKGETVEGSTVDMAAVGAEFGTGPIEAASVKDEMSDLMEDFDKGTPAWAAGAMRNATAALASRGLGASSMAGMAVVQAAMEAALPIAQMDAANKQEMNMFKAEQRAKFMGMDFDQKFQAKVINASKISEIANMNFTAQQQIAIENSRAANTMELANLNNRQAKIMADAATISQREMANLDNRQQAAVQNAQAFLAMDMANLDNEQQATMFRAQEQVNAILSDTAAQNAAKQFNATSENQTNQFFASLATQVSQFNSEQTNAMARFNAGEANALAQFNTAQDNAFAQFNAQNHLVVAQANAAWAQAVTTAENAAQNQANRDAALAANNLTMTAYNNIVQRERDTLAWAWQSAENAAERDANIAIAKIQGANKDKSDSLLSAASGAFLGKLAVHAADKIFLG